LIVRNFASKSSSSAPIIVPERTKSRGAAIGSSLVNTTPSRPAIACSWSVTSPDSHGPFEVLTWKPRVFRSTSSTVAK
jgi:hypothetical protein